jgi:hypothetical protein
VYSSRRGEVCEIPRPLYYGILFVEHVCVAAVYRIIGRVSRCLVQEIGIKNM